AQPVPPLVLHPVNKDAWAAGLRLPLRLRLTLLGRRDVGRHTRRARGDDRRPGGGREVRGARGAHVASPWVCPVTRASSAVTRSARSLARQGRVIGPAADAVVTVTLASPKSRM